jgi:hypothetical protein
MGGLRELRNILLHLHARGIINQQFMLLYDLNKSKNPDWPYWNFPKFELDKINK